MANPRLHELIYCDFCDALHHYGTGRAIESPDKQYRLWACKQCKDEVKPENVIAVLIARQLES